MKYLFSTRKDLILFFIMTVLMAAFSSTAFAKVPFNRIAGLDRYETSIEISKSGWSQSYYALLATGEDFPDSLSAGPLAKKYSAPILLTGKHSISGDLEAELSRLNVRHVFILGGIGVISDDIFNQLKGMGLYVERLAGEDRFETSIKIAEKIGASSEIAVVDGEDFGDALSISSIAASKNIPVILVPGNYLTESISDYIGNKNINKTYIIGDSSSISDEAAGQFPNPERITGSDNYDRNIAIINRFSNDIDFSNVYLATGNDFPDSLSGSALAAKTNSPIVLINKSDTTRVKALLKNKNTNILKVLGGEAVVNGGAVDEISRSIAASDLIAIPTPTAPEAPVVPAGPTGPTAPAAPAAPIPPAVPTPPTAPTPSPTPSTPPAANTGATPGAMTVSSSKSSYTTGEDIVLNWTASKNAVRYGLTIRKAPYEGDANIVYNTPDLTGSSVNVGKLPEGSYRFAMRGYSSSGKGGNVSNIVYFTVVKDTASKGVIFPVDINAGSWYALTYGGSAASKGSHWGTAYRAIDLNLPGHKDKGKPVKAVADGKVVKIHPSHGEVHIKHTVPLILKDGSRTYKTWFTVYAHMSSITVKVGDDVKQGKEIGKISNVGADSEHLHFVVTTKLKNGNDVSREDMYNSYTLSPLWLGGDYEKIQYNPANSSDQYDKKAVLRLKEPTSNAPGSN